MALLRIVLYHNAVFNWVLVTTDRAINYLLVIVSIFTQPHVAFTLYDQDRTKPKKGSQTVRSGGKNHKKARTRKERYMDVEDYWKRVSSPVRRKLLRVPVISMLDGEGGKGHLGMRDNTAVLKYSIYYLDLRCLMF